MQLSFKTFTYLFFVAYFSVNLLVFLVWIIEKPINGDLTRIGYYSENDFGWQGLVHRFESNVDKQASLQNEYDIVVLGDSFSMNQASWIDILQQLTQLRIGVFHHKDYNIDSMLEVLSENNKMPPIFIYESAERELELRLNKARGCEDSGASSFKTKPLKIKKTPFESIKIERKNVKSFPDFGYILKFIFVNFFNRQTDSKVVERTLKRKDLFSHKKSDKILLYNREFRKSEWSVETWNNIKCNALYIQGLIEKNQHTKFVFLVAPDKSTVYNDFFLGDHRSTSRLDILASDASLNYIRVDDILQTKVSEAQKDIYFPNDTHWSFQGHFIVAQKVLADLIDLNALTYADTAK